MSNGSTFVRALAMGSLQFCSVVKTGSLPVLSPNLAPPKPPTVQNEETNDNQQACVSIAAGKESSTQLLSGFFKNKI